MRILMVVYDFMPFGGLEEIVVSLARALQARGHQVAILSTAWAPPENQYRKQLAQQGTRLDQPPKWLSDLATDWSAKEHAVAMLMRLLTPVVYVLAILLFVRRRAWARSMASARGWLNGRLMGLIAPNRRESLTRWLLAWLYWRWRPDLVHIHGYTSILAFVLDWTYEARLPSVYEEHQTPDAQFDWWDGTTAQFNKATCVVAVSEKSAEALRNVCLVRRPIYTMTPIVADPVETMGPSALALREGDENLILTVVARLGVTKGLLYLLEATARARAVCPSIQLRVYGDGPLRAELLSYARELGLDEERIFVGTFERQELPQIMAQTDIFVMSSILEGLPLALVEAMAYGRPIVATTVGGIPELIEDGVSGLLCPPGDSEALAEKLICLLEDPARRAALGQAARRAYESGRFHPDAVCERFEAIYRAAMTDRERVA